MSIDGPDATTIASDAERQSSVSDGPIRHGVPTGGSAAGGGASGRSVSSRSYASTTTYRAGTPARPYGSGRVTCTRLPARAGPVPASRGVAKGAARGVERGARTGRRLDRPAAPFVAAVTCVEAMVDPFSRGTVRALG